jgi:3-methyladenine DNA glycosylase AlkD
VLELAELLWQRGVHELRVAAVEILVDAAPRLIATDVAFVEKLIRDSNTWALVDPLAATVVGGLIVRFPKLNARLDRWVGDDNFWIRRSALLALLGPLRRGEGDFERFGRYADALLDEKEFFIRKAIGWVLRETSKRRPGLVYEWLEPRIARASGVTMREALRYLSPSQQKKLAGARRGADVEVARRVRSRPTKTRARAGSSG